ncbi:Type-1 restriction enzyme EcoKI specificity protein [bioreactor metagenome]|uniref:Type-1 restriction enzyme EcoKI specificity protein n=1 Tax=bioreactor metagenome TaxID=1076179 RepID=A0A644UFK3_9ZZZZ
MTRKMKDSGVEWIGEIPEDWVINPLSNRFKEHKVKNIGNTEKNVLSLSYGHIVKRNVDNNKGLLPESFETYNIVFPGNIVLRLTDLQNDQKSWRVGLVKDKGIITSAYLTLEAECNDISNTFYYYLFHIYDRTKIIYNMGNGVRQNLKYSELCKLPIVVPPIEQQNHIASFLDTKCSLIDAAVQKERGIIGKLKEYRQAVITEAVTKGIRAGVPMKDSGVEWIGEIPEGWDVIKLGFVADVQTGPFGSQLHNEDYVEEGTPIITVEHFGDNIINHSNLPLVSDEDVIRLKKYILIDGDLVFSRVGSVDRCVLVSPEEQGWLFSGRCLRVRLGNNVNKKFINYCFNKKAFREYMNLIAVGSTMPSINTSILSNVKIPMPSFEEQTSIVFHLDAKCSAIDATIQKRELAIEKLTAYKQSLIYECVTGKKEVLG